MPLETSVSLAELVDRVAWAFSERHGRAASVVSAAPGRVNLIGEHTDYNDGFVLPMAIDRYTVVAAAGAEHGRARIASATMGGEATLPLDGTIAEEGPGWAKYASGVLGVYADEGLRSAPLDAVIDSTVPLGGGLSSSAALEVSLATALEAISGHGVSPAQRALLCQRAEHRAGTPCGIMDQFSSALCEEDRLLLLDCLDQSVKMQPLDDPGVTVLITNSNVKHELTGGEYAERRTQCEEAAAALGVASLRDATLQQVTDRLEGVLLQRARHVVGEIERTLLAAEALEGGRWSHVGELMYASHDSLRDDFEVSCPELDTLVEAARNLGEPGGVYGSRMTGGGFGGCTVSLVKSGAAEEVADSIADRYQAETGKVATQFITRPARGAHLVIG